VEGHQMGPSHPLGLLPGGDGVVRAVQVLPLAADQLRARYSDPGAQDRPLPTSGCAASARSGQGRDREKQQQQGKTPAHEGGKRGRRLARYPASPLSIPCDETIRGNPRYLGG
jgi:hypothetical protein